MTGHPGTRPVTPGERDRALSMVEAGWSLEDMRAALGRSRSWCHSIRKQARAGARSIPGVSAHEEREIERLTRLGYSAPWIGWILDRDPTEIIRLRRMRGWVADPAQPRRTHHPPVGVLPWGQWESQTFAAKQARQTPKRVALPVIRDTSDPLPVEASRREAPRERDIWCRRADACLDLVIAHNERVGVDSRWEGFSCRACSIRGTDQEDTAGRLRGLALAREWLETRQGRPDHGGEE